MTNHPNAPDTNVQSEQPVNNPEVSGSTKEQTQEARREVERAAEHLQKTGQQTTQHVQEQISQASAGAKQKASQVIDQSKAEVAAYLNEQKKTAANKVAHVGEALGRAADKLHEENDHDLAQYAEAVAGDTSRIASYMRDQDTQTLMSDTRSFVRRHPGAAFAGLFVAGMAICRFLKASEQQDAERERRNRNLAEGLPASQGEAGSHPESASP